MVNTVSLTNGRTVQFESANDVLLFMGATLTFQQFAQVYQKAQGKIPPLRLYRNNNTPEARVRFLALAASKQCSDGALLIDVLPPGFREEWERIRK